jgi:hypothetical protein
MVPTSSNVYTLFGAWGAYRNGVWKITIIG